MASAIVNAADIMAVKVFCYLNNQVGINTYYYVCTSTVGVTVTYADVAARMDVLFGPLYRAILASSASYELVHEQRISPLPLLVPSEAFANSGVGTGGASAMPTQTCGVLSIQAGGFAGRGYRGRKYLPFPGSNAISGTGLPNAAYQALVVNLGTAAIAAQTVVDGASSAVLGPVLYHKKTPLSPTPLSAAFPTAKWATQKRRGSYGQPNVIPT